MTPRLKRSIAVVVLRDGQVLTTRRAPEDDEFPGVWGLPAASFRVSETVAEVVGRIGRDKLHVELRPRRKLAVGAQDRKDYRLEMELWEVEMTGLPQHPEWKWDQWVALKPGKEQGSLCCDLALRWSAELPQK